MDFKYRTKFTLNNISKASLDNILLANESLDDLKRLMPTEQEINDNDDLLYVSFNAAVVNLINQNDHGILTTEAIEMAPRFRDKQLNVEHNRSFVVGHAKNFGFSSFGGNQIISPNEAARINDPFNISLAGVVYRVVDPEFTSFLEESADEDSPMHGMISASWEVGFDEFGVALGSKRLSDAEIITDRDKVEELSPFLRNAGGNGFLDDGTPIYMIISGPRIVPLGCGFTAAPAASVRGVIVASDETLSLKDAMNYKFKNEKEAYEAAEKIGLAQIHKLTKTDKEGNVEEYFVPGADTEEFIETLKNKVEALRGFSVLPGGNKIHKPNGDTRLPLDEPIEPIRLINEYTQTELERKEDYEDFEIAEKQRQEELEELQRKASSVRTSFAKEAVIATFEDKVILYNEDLTQFDINKDTITDHTKLEKIKEIYATLDKIFNLQLKNKKTCVKQGNQTNIKMAKLTREQLENLEQVDASSVTALFDDLERINSQYEEEKAKKDELEGKHEKAVQDIEEIKTQLAAVQQERDNIAREQVLNERMASITESFELSEEQESAVASQIKELDEEGYNTWFENFKLFAKEKSSVPDNSTNASVFDNVEVESRNIPNSTSTEKLDDYKDLFSTGIQITSSRFNK